MIKKCDYHGTCKNKPFKEVYPMALGGKYANRGWSYLCKKHFLQEEERFKWKLPYSSAGLERMAPIFGMPAKRVRKQKFST